MLVSRVSVLAAWDYSGQAWLKERLDVVAGSTKLVIRAFGTAVELGEPHLGRLEPPRSC